MDLTDENEVKVGKEDTYRVGRLGPPRVVRQTDEEVRSRSPPRLRRIGPPEVTPLEGRQGSPLTDRKTQDPKGWGWVGVRPRWTTTESLGSGLSTPLETQGPRR